MNDTLKAIVRVLEEGTPELQVAAAQILGELRPKAPAVTRALAEHVVPGEPLITRYALEALASIGTDDAVEVLVQCLHQGGAIAERVTHLLGRMGVEATKALSRLFDAGDREMRERILEILGHHSDREALTVMRKALLNGDPVISAKAAEVLAARVRELDDEQRESLRAGLQKALSGKAVASLAPEAVAQGLTVLGSLDGRASRATAMRFTGVRHAPVVRQAALRALEGVPLTQNQAETLLGYLAEGDMTHVVRPVMHLLVDVDRWSSGAIARLKKLLGDERVEVRLFALRALRTCHTAEVAKLAMPHLLGKDPAFREAAAEVLGENPAAVEGLLKAFQSERNPDRARWIGAALRRHGGAVKRAQIRSLADKAGKLLAAGEPLGEVYLDVLLALDPEAGPAELVDKALRQRRAKRLADTLTILMRLARTEHMPPEGRYQLAVARLLADMQSQAGGGKDETGSATMGHFAMLVREGFPLLERLKKEGQLEPDALLRVGKHFAGQVGPERRFGTELLHHLAQRHGRHPAGADAKLMLRTAGA